MHKHKAPSPEVISGRLQKLFDITVSKNTLYRYICRDRLAGGKLYLQLPHRGKRYRYDTGEPQRSAIPDRVGIKHRSDEAELKRHPGLSSGSQNMVVKS